ncbi:type III secretion system translocator chaperone SicA [Pseudomonas sp. PCH199]|uniref:type III secretion system translocator chaperone SicA n=1 Tax=unclassified Pseudomonas TaxID=196821 RepID=UPI000BDBF4A9|nr:MULTISPECIES: type III secretion system translocator chaperone SicA [unclassified Pseudomonas]MCW8277091.1 type III secretion system translocator chaperone SicA [Pseudomonas sp. PCH199]PAM82589.1 CesD/SycD/LcrH family type III secretion system chaperone [Pseudomonas sp. ERMR1:02]
MSRNNKQDEQVALEVVDAVLAGAALKDVQGISDEQMNSLYAFAYQFYEQGRLDDAEKFFHFLCIYDFYNSHYWMGLAAVHQLKQNHQKAIDLYAIAFAQGKSDWRPMFYTGQCQLALGRIGKARLCFEYVLEQATEDDLRKQARVYLDTLSQIEKDCSENGT